MFKYYIYVYGLKTLLVPMSKISVLVTQNFCINSILTKTFICLFPLKFTMLELFSKRVSFALFKYNVLKTTILTFIFNYFTKSYLYKGNKILFIH